MQCAVSYTSNLLHPVKHGQSPMATSHPTAGEYRAEKGLGQVPSFFLMKKKNGRVKESVVL